MRRYAGGMEILIGLLIVGIVGVVALWAIAGTIAVGSWAKDTDTRDAAAGRADETLDGIFGSDAGEVVTYATQPADTLRPPAVIAGAAERGYKLLHDDKGTLTFGRN